MKWEPQMNFLFQGLGETDGFLQKGSLTKKPRCTWALLLWLLVQALAGA